MRASHFAIIFFQAIATKSTRKLTKSTDQRRIYDVNRMSTSKNKKASETFGTEILYVPSTQFSEIFDSKADSKALERGDSWHFLMPVETGL